MLWVLTGILVYSAVLRVMEDNYEIDASVMLITAGTGVAFNIVYVSDLTFLWILQYHYVATALTLIHFRVENSGVIAIKFYIRKKICVFVSRSV